jgi:hypothetical protein
MFKVVTPVAFPPGRFRLVTSPNLTGSTATPKTIGILAVAALAAIADGASAGRDNDCHLPLHQFICKRWQPINLIFRPAILDP